MKRNIMVSLVTCLVAGAIAVVSQAQLGGSTASDMSVPELVPYRGYVERGGVPYAGNVDLRFGIYGASAAGTPYWQSQHLGVSVAGGRFSVQLGSQTPFTSLFSPTPDGRPLFQQDSLYLGVEVKFPGEASYTILSNRQRLLAAPYAMTARQAERLDTTDNVNVGGNLTVGSASAGRTATVNGSATITGSVSVGGALLRDAGQWYAGAGQNVSTGQSTSTSVCFVSAVANGANCSVQPNAGDGFWHVANTAGAGDCFGRCVKWTN